jgi:hypothetical protein
MLHPCQQDIKVAIGKCSRQHVQLIKIGAFDIFGYFPFAVKQMSGPVLFGGPDPQIKRGCSLRIEIA